MLIRFAERGLVLNGRPNLQLFNQLFWTILVSYYAIGICMAPPYSLFSTKSFHYAFGTKVCLARSIADHDVLKRNVVPLFLTATLGWVIVVLLKARTKQLHIIHNVRYEGDNTFLFMAIQISNLSLDQMIAGVSKNLTAV